MRLVKPSFSIMAMSGHPELPYQYENPLPLIEAAGKTCYKSEKSIGPGTAEKFVKMIENNKHLSVMEHSWRTRHYSYLNTPMLLSLVGSDSLLSISSIMEDVIISGNMRMFDDLENCLPYQWWYTHLCNEEAKELNLGPKHFSATVRFICDRGVTHELVRHRLASYSQESTRFCDYSKSKFENHVTFVIPPWINIEPCTLDKGDVEKIYNSIPYTPEDDEAYEWLMDCIHTEKAYKCKLARGRSPQQARGKLTNELKTEIVMTATWQQWQHVFNMRSIGVAGKPHPQMLEIMQPCHEAFKQLEPECFK